MKVVAEPAELRAALAAARREGRDDRPGADHGLPARGPPLAAARAPASECDVVVMSLFVNPAQFGPGEDLDALPARRGARRSSSAEAEGVDLVYAPAVEEVYPPGFATAVEVGGASPRCSAATRPSRGPEHFRGVTTVVAKLFNCVEPDVAYFGQKDAQQAVVIRRMVRRPRLPGPDRGAARRSARPTAWR